MTDVKPKIRFPTKSRFYLGCITIEEVEKQARSFLKALEMEIPGELSIDEESQQLIIGNIKFDIKDEHGFYYLTPTSEEVTLTSLKEPEGLAQFGLQKKNEFYKFDFFNLGIIKHALQIASPETIEPIIMNIIGNDKDGSMTNKMLRMMREMPSREIVLKKFIDRKPDGSEKDNLEKGEAVVDILNAVTAKFVGAASGREKKNWYNALNRILDPGGSLVKKFSYRNTLLTALKTGSDELDAEINRLVAEVDEKETEMLASVRRGVKEEITKSENELKKVRELLLEKWDVKDKLEKSKDTVKKSIKQVMISSKGKLLCKLVKDNSLMNAIQFSGNDIKDIISGIVKSLSVATHPKSQKYLNDALNRMLFRPSIEGGFDFRKRLLSGDPGESIDRITDIIRADSNGEITERILNDPSLWKEVERFSDKVKTIAYAILSKCWSLDLSYPPTEGWRRAIERFMRSNNDVSFVKILRQCKGEDVKDLLDDFEKLSTKKVKRRLKPKPRRS